jgi:hypothetical protein
MHVTTLANQLRCEPVMIFCELVVNLCSTLYSISTPKKNEVETNPIDLFLRYTHVSARASASRSTPRGRPRSYPPPGPHPTP